MSDTRFTTHTCPALGEVYYEATHPSGLRVLVCPKDLSAYYATVGVRYGSMDLPAGQGIGKQSYPMGVAHFLEHKLFEKADGGDADTDFASIGAEVNAFTSYDRTAYLFSCTDRFDEALAHLLRMVSDLTVTDASVARERDIIAEEIRMSKILAMTPFFFLFLLPLKETTRKSSRWMVQKSSKGVWRL